MMSSEKTSLEESNQSFHMAGAAVLGMSIAFGFMTQQGGSAVIFSLINEGNWFRDSGALLLLRVSVLACCFLFPFQKKLYAITGLFLVISWISLYSVTGAFILPLGTSCAFFYFAYAQTKSVRRMGAIMMLALPFLLSAIQKMNPAYLRGDEFLPNGSFLAFLYSWGLPLNTIPTGLQTVIPIVSIVVELSIFVGLFLRPERFAQLSLIFALVLSFVHPPVIFVYGVFFPFALLIDETWAEKLNATRAAIALRQPYFWCAATIFSFIRSTNFTISAVKVWPVAGLLLIYHMRMLFRSDVEMSQRFAVPIFLQQPRAAVGPVLIVCTFIAFLLGAPKPVGYSMFSGRALAANSHVLHVSNREICAHILERWTFSLVVDAGSAAQSDGTCLIKFPTNSGLRGMKEKLCSIDPSVEWSTRARGSEIFTTENCGQPQSRVE